MRRIARHLITALTILSLFLCASATALWMASYFASWSITHHGPVIPWLDAQERTEFEVESSRGRVFCFSGTHWYKPMPPDPEGWAFSTAAPGAMQCAGGGDEPTVWERGGFAWNAPNGSMVGTEVMLPHWLPCVVFALLPGFRLQHRLRRMRPSNGACPTYGYDLRATPNRCPECGTTNINARGTT
jgi:hypothetical protein